MLYIINKFFIEKPVIRRFITRLLEGDKNRDISLLGSKIRINSIKEHGYLRSSRLANSSALLRDELPVLLNLAAILSDNDTFIDIGANVGVYSHVMSRLSKIKKNVKIVAFEANPDTFSRLNTYTTSNNIQAFNIALSDHEGTLEFLEGAVSHVFTVASKAKYSYKSKPIYAPCQRLDKIDLPGNSLVLKIDVEGQEMSVIDGATDLFSTNRIKAVYLDGYENKEEIEQKLLEHNFDLYEGKSLEPVKGNVYSLLAIRKQINSSHHY